MVTIPVVEESLGSCVTFILALFTIVFGLLQRIICAIADRFAELRERNLATRVREIEQTEAAQDAR